LIIVRRHKANPGAKTPREVGALGFAAGISRMNRNVRKGTSSSVFNLLMINPCPSSIRRRANWPSPACLPSADCS
jgi:hypothetical protein